MSNESPEMHSCRNRIRKGKSLHLVRVEQVKESAKGGMLSGFAYCRIDSRYDFIRRLRKPKIIVADS